MTEPLVARLREILHDEGGGDEALGRRFVLLVRFDSDARYGLDADGHWIAVLPTSSGSGEQTLGLYTESEAHVFYEALEQPRSTFENRIEDGARANGLAPERVLLSFPAVAVVRAVLAKEFAYLTRLALLWIHPTELRELRPDLVRLTQSPHLPVSIKDLAERLIVPE